MPALYFYKNFEGAPDGLVDLADDPQASYQVWKIGRHSDNDIVILDKRISRYCVIISHRLIRNPNGGWSDYFYLEDLSSHNGIWLNGVKLAPNDPSPLRPKDKICFGWADAKAAFLRGADDTLDDGIWQQPGWPTNDELLFDALQRSVVSPAGTIASRIDPDKPIVAEIDNPWELIAWIVASLWEKVEPLPVWARFGIFGTLALAGVVILYEWVR